MTECGHCYGEGSEEYEEDGCFYKERCLHCSGTGQLDDEAMWRESLASVATSLALNRVSEKRKYANEDPDGEDWAFRAAENMLTEYEYTQEMYYTYFYEYSEEISKLSFEQQEVLIAWNNFNHENRMGSRRKSDSKGNEGQEAFHL